MINEESFLDFNCPYCGERISFPETTVGFPQECPSCLESVLVPQPGSEAGRKIPVPILTARLRLRRFAVNDWKALLALLSADEKFIYVDGLPGPGEEEVMRWLEADYHVRLTTPNQVFRLAIELQEGGKLIGVLGLWFTDTQRLQATFHLSLHADYQHQGFAREAVDALLAFCFQEIKLHRLAARCDSRNAAACKLCEHAGLRREGEFVKDQPLLEGGWSNSIWYAALEEEYRPAAGGTKQEGPGGSPAPKAD
jgi:RimJ/RimL family protein N-acetyltransferase